MSDTKINYFKCDTNKTDEIMRIICSKIGQHLQEQKRISRLDNIQKDIDLVIETINVIGALGKKEKRVIDMTGLDHNIDEYEVAPQFERLCSSRGIYFDDSDFSINLKLNSNENSRIQGIHEWISDGSNKDVISLAREARSLAITVPMTPAEFRTAQVKIINAVKGKVDHWTSIDEVTKPMILSSVKIFTDGTYVSDPGGDWTELPSMLTIYEHIYEPFKYNLPIVEYADNFAMHFVMDL